MKKRTVPELDSGRGDPKNILAAIMEAVDGNFYHVGMMYGILK